MECANGPEVIDIWTEHEKVEELQKKLCSRKPAVGPPRQPQNMAYVPMELWQVVASFMDAPTYQRWIHLFFSNRLYLSFIRVCQQSYKTFRVEQVSFAFRREYADHVSDELLAKFLSRRSRDRLVAISLGSPCLTPETFELLLEFTNLKSLDLRFGVTKQIY